MPEVIFNGPEGRLEGRYQPGRDEFSPLALILHSNPQTGGSMNNKVAYTLFQTFHMLGFSVLRFNFRGVGRSQGTYDGGTGELGDAAAALDWLQTVNKDAKTCWIAGHSFGAWIGMQLLMRRPEISGFISAEYFMYAIVAANIVSSILSFMVKEPVVKENPNGGIAGKNENSDEK